MNDKFEPNESRSIRMGRPPLPAETARRNRLVTFVTDSELELLRRHADTEGVTLSAMMHRILKHSLEELS